MPHFGLVREYCNVTLVIIRILQLWDPREKEDYGFSLADDNALMFILHSLI